MESKKIILIEDDDTLRSAIETFLKRLEFEVKSYSDGETALRQIDESCDLILSDVMMGQLSGYELLKFIRKKLPQTPVILMTAFGTVEKAVEAMKNGAYDFLIKPFSLSVLETTLNAAFMDRQPAQQKEVSSPDLTRLPSARMSQRFITNNPRMLEIIDNVKRIAPSKATVLIQGESGTGKELIAKMIHEFSPRSQRIFVAINCAAMPDSLLESELFGHEKGAFTGAVARHVGKFELSNNGTILLDEISEMSLTMQTKLLRVLQECEVYRVGGIKPIPLNIRVIATTNRDLFQYMKEGQFREDLFYRINVIPIKMIPLRERGDDILVMAKDFLEEFAVLHGRKPLAVGEADAQKILNHPWPGNVRELRNAMERATLVGDFDVIGEGAVTQAVPVPDGPVDGAETEPFVSETLEEIEKKAILLTLHHCEGNKTRTATKLGISLRTLRNKLKQYGVQVGEAD